MTKDKINTRQGVIPKPYRFKLLETLEKQLKSHDWFYEYADDNRYYLSGSKEREDIWKTIEELQEIGENEFDQAIDMYKKYKPVVKYQHEREIGRNY